MADEWFFRVSFAELGPFSTEEMRTFFQNGRIKSDTLVRRGDAGAWAKASEVDGLLSLTITPSASMPPAMPPRPSAAGKPAAAPKPQAPKTPAQKPAAPKPSASKPSPGKPTGDASGAPPRRPAQPSGGQPPARRPASPSSEPGRAADKPPARGSSRPPQSRSTAADQADPLGNASSKKPTARREGNSSSGGRSDDGSGKSAAPSAPKKKKGLNAADLLAAIEPTPPPPEPEPAPQPEVKPVAEPKIQFQMPTLTLNRNSMLILAGCLGVVVVCVLLVMGLMKATRRPPTQQELAQQIPVMDQPDVPVMDAPAEGAVPPAGQEVQAVVPDAVEPTPAPEAKMNAPKPGAPGVKYSTEEIVNRCENSVAMVKGARGSGTGFIVRPGIVITNKHVIAQESPSSLQFIFPSCPVAERGPYGASLLYEDESLDIAVLKTGAPQPPLSIATDYHFRRGHEVTVIGNPGAFDGQILQNAVSRGIMSTEATIDGQPYYQLGIAINPGNSGGPVFDEYANVIGIVTLKDANKEGIGFCIPLFKLREVLDRVDKLTPRQVELAGSFHRTKLVFLSLRSLGQAYSEIVSMWVTEMKSAQERDKITQRFANPAGRKRGAAAMEQDQGRSFALQADKDFKERIRKVLAKVDTGMFTNLDAEIDKVINDPVLKEEVRKQFHDYWNNYVELRQAADEPRGNFEQYFKKFADLEKQRKSVSGALQTTLGVPPLDEER